MSASIGLTPEQMYRRKKAAEMSKRRKPLSETAVMSHRDIAALLGISVVRVQQIEQTALQKLYNRLKGDEDANSGG